MRFPTVKELDPRTARPAAPDAAARRIGWRLEPALGPLTSAAMLEPGAVYPADGASDLRAAAELALWIRTAPDEADWRGGASRVVGGLASTLHVVDGEQPGRGAFAIGAVHSFAPTAGREARLWVDGELWDRGALLEDYAETVRAAQRRLSEMGATLCPGDFLLAPSGVYAPVGPGTRVAVEIDGLERLELSIGA